MCDLEEIISEINTTFVKDRKVGDRMESPLYCWFVARCTNQKQLPSQGAYKVIRAAGAGTAIVEGKREPL